MPAEAAEQSRAQMTANNPVLRFGEQAECRVGVLRSAVGQEQDRRDSRRDQFSADGVAVSCQAGSVEGLPLNVV